MTVERTTEVVAKRMQTYQRISKWKADTRKQHVKDMM